MLKNLIFLLDEEENQKLEQQIATGSLEKSGKLGNLEGYEKQETLLVTSSLSLAKIFQEKGYFMVLALTDENKNQSFQGFRFAVMDATEIEPDYYEGVYKRFVGEPWTILETDRCIIRETIEADVDAFYEIYDNPDITKYMEPLFEKKEEELEYTRNYRRNIYEFYGFGMWTVLEKDTQKVIGRAGVSYREGCDVPELGFMIAKEYQRKGLAFEVCSAILSFMKENYEMDSIQILVAPENTPSIQLCNKLGARLQRTEYMGHYNCYIIDNYLSAS